MPQRIPRSWLIVIAFLIGTAAIVYYPLPYYVSKPGEAIALAPMIQVEDGYSGNGTLMITTVRMGSANIVNYSWARLNSYMDVIEKDTVLASYENEEEYGRHQMQVMSLSQKNALLVGYRLAGKKANVENRGAMVTAVQEGMPAREHLQIGDVIIKVDEQNIWTVEELVQYMEHKELGDIIEVTYVREDQKYQATLELHELELTEQEKENQVEPRAGIGVSLITDRDIDVQPDVSIQTDQIGGPSAGLMFSMEIYNQLSEKDITKGYQIAGTGTIDQEGNVGRIGGVHQKVVAADQAGADIFFVPNEQGSPQSNYRTAAETAIDIQTEMDIVPVDNIEEALIYLEKLPSK